MKFIDFFSGIGGIRLGLEQAGHKCVGFCEFDKYARQSYKAMYDTKGEWESHDIRSVIISELPKANLWCYGFPCQDLSISGKRKGLQEGKRSKLFYEIIRLLQSCTEENKPEWLLAENVKGLFSSGNGFDFARCLVELGGVGYDTEWQLLNSKDFGVPQNRERVFLIGHLRTRGERKVFPISPADGTNCNELKELTTKMPQGNRIYEPNGLSCTLSSNGGGQGAKTGLYAVACLTPDREKKRQNGRRFKTENEPSFTLTAQDRQGIAIIQTDSISKQASKQAIDLTENKPKITKNARCLTARYTAGITNFAATNSGVIIKSKE